MKKQVDDPGGPGSPAARKKQKTVPSRVEKEEKKKQRGEALRRRRQERQLYDDMVVKACLLEHIKNPYREKSRDAIKKRLDSYSKSIVRASSGLMRMAREMYRDVTHMETVEIPDEFFDNIFVRYLMLGTRETRRENERVHALHENFAEFRFEGTRYIGNRDIYEHGAMNYLTNLRNHLTMNLERFMIRAVFALYPGLSRKGVWSIINGITNDHKHEDEIEFVGEKASRRRRCKTSVIRAAIQERRGVLGLPSPAEKISELKKDKERHYRLILRYFLFLDLELERKAEIKLRGEKMKSGRDGRIS
jgi:hypothetical protein